MSQLHRVDPSGIPLPVVFAALFAVADSPWDTPGQRTSEPLPLAEAAWCVGSDPVNVFTATLRGRAIGIQIERPNRINAIGFDKANAGGRPLAQAVVDRLREEPPFMLDSVHSHPGGDELVRGWALDALRRVDLGRAWRIEMFDGLPTPPIMRGSEAEFALVRRAWVAADEDVRDDPNLDPMPALMRASGQFMGSGLVWEAVGTRMVSVVGTRLDATRGGLDARRSAWRDCPGLLAGVVPTWPLQTNRTHPDVDRNVGFGL